MTVANWLTLFGIIVAALVALIIADMQRRQTRQIELHRQNPHLPLTPPSRPAVRFIRKWGLYIAGIVLPILSLCLESRQKGPVTQREMLAVAFNVLVVVIMMGAMITRELLQFLDRLTDVVAWLVEERDKKKP